MVGCAGCKAEVCSYNGGYGNKVEGQELSAWFAELAIGIILLIVGIVFSCGCCLMCCWGKDEGDCAPAGEVQEAAPAAAQVGVPQMEQKEQATEQA